MSTVTKQTIVIYQGDSSSGSFPYENAADGDLAFGAVAAWTGAEPMAALDVTVDVSSKLVRWSVSSATSSGLKRSGRFDLRVRKSGGDVDTVAYGPAILRAQVATVPLGLTWAEWEALNWADWEQLPFAEFGAAS